MRVVVLGGTRFIGRAIVEELSTTGHDLLVVHRGELEPDDMPPVAHLHCDRSELTARRDELVAFHPDAAIDCRALTREDAQIALDALPDGVRLVVISSLDVYRAFGALNDNRETDQPQKRHPCPGDLLLSGILPANLYLSRLEPPRNSVRHFGSAGLRPSGSLQEPDLAPSG